MSRLQSFQSFQSETIVLHFWNPSVFSRLPVPACPGSPFAAPFPRLFLNSKRPLGNEVSLLAPIGIKVSWTRTGTLQSAPAVVGPWNHETGAANGQVFPNIGTKFYRLAH